MILCTEISLFHRNCDVNKLNSQTFDSYSMMRCLNILISLHLILLPTQSLLRRLDKYEKESFVVSLNFYRAAISNPTAANMNFLVTQT